MQRSDEELEQSLRALHETELRERPIPGVDEAELARLLARFDGRVEQNPRRRLAVLSSWRWAAAAAVAAIGLVAACVAPTSYEVPLGLGLEVVDFDAELVSPRALADFLQEASGAEEVGVEARIEDRNGEQTTRLDVRMWGAVLEPEELEAVLVDEFPALEEAASIEVRALEGEVRTTLGRRLLHDVLGEVEREEDVEAARVRLVEELRAQGVEGEIEVQIRDRADGRREIEVGVEAHAVETAD